MIGAKIYHFALLIMREKGNDSNGSKINRRKWAEEECGAVMGNDGEDWKSIEASQWRLNLKGTVLRHVLLSPYEVYEISMVGNREGGNPRLKLRVGPTGNTGSYAALNIITHPIGGIVGRRSVAEVDSSLSLSGYIAIPIPEYGYLMGGRILNGN